MRLAPLALTLALAGCVAPTASPVAPPVTATAPERRSLAQEIAATPTLLHFAAGVRASGTPRLAAAQPVTVIAMTDDAYGRLAPEVPESLLAPDNHAMLVRLVDYHLVEGAIDRAELRRRVTAGGGTAELATLAGEPMVVTLTGDVPTLTNADGDHAFVTDEIVRPNGVLLLTNGFLAPRMP
jgi:uncharacterized surface protein with fasciclin (FAS1) repeats